MIALGVILAIILALLCMPVGVTLRYDKQGGVVLLKLGPVSVPLYPRGKKEEYAKQVKKKSAASKTKDKKMQGGALTDFLPIVNVILDFLNEFRVKLWVQNLEFKLIMADADPCDLAVNYGRAWAVLGSFFPLLEQFVKIKKRNLEVECDFFATETQVYAQANILISLGNFLYLFSRHGAHAFKHYLKITKTIKAVQ